MEQKTNTRKTIWREPTEDDPRRRVYRKPEEHRNKFLQFRITEGEYVEFYRYARSYKTTMSYLVREAIQEKYPQIFSTLLNKNIRKPRKKPKPLDPPTQILHSYADGSTKIFDIPDDDLELDDNEETE